MNRKVLVSILVLATLTIASIGGVVLYRSANAAGPTLLSGTTNEVGPGRGGPGRGLEGRASNEDLASALSITVDELNAAYQKANEAALAQAVEDGLITQAQADQLKSDGQAFPLGGRWMGWLKQQGVDTEALLAEALGISTDKLQAAYTQAEQAHIEQAVTDGRLTQDQAELMKAQRALAASESFKTAMQTAYEAAVKQAVSYGTITQTQADLVLQAASQKGDGMGMPFMDGGHGRGGFGGPGSGERNFGPESGGQPAYPDPSAPATTPSSSGL